MCNTIASLIEGRHHICISYLFLIGLNPYNVYVLLYGAPTYGDISIFPYLGYSIGDYIWILIFTGSFVNL